MNRSCTLRGSPGWSRIPLRTLPLVSLISSVRLLTSHYSPLKDSRKTLHSLDIYTPVLKRKHHKQTYRPKFSFPPSPQHFMNHHANNRGFKDSDTLLPPSLRLVPTPTCHPRVSRDGKFKVCIPILMPCHIAPQTFGGCLTFFTCNWKQ